MTSTDQPRALLIVNPAARRGSRTLEVAADAIEREGYRCDLLITSEQGEAAQAVAAEASRFDVIFTLGGDGTVMEVLGAMPEDGPPLGILQGGTGNLIANALRIPYGVRRAVRALVRGNPARIDLGRLPDGRRFAVAAGVGVDAAMVAETPRGLKRRFGVLAYFLTGTRALLRFERFRVRITVDGRVHEQVANAVLVANFGALLHDLITLGDGISYDDGALNVCVFAPVTVRDGMRVARRLLRRDFRPDPSIWYDAGSSILVETFPSRPMQADGEMLGETPLAVEVEPLRGRVLLPERAGRGRARSRRGRLHASGSYHSSQ